MVSDKIIKKVEEKIFKDQTINPFQKFGFKCNLRIEAPQELADLMVGYDKYSEELWTELGILMNTNSDKNLKIAIVGPQGIGKTSLVTDFANSINLAKKKDQSQIAKSVNYVIFYPFRYLSKPDISSFDMFFLKQDMQKVVIAFDDFQTILYPTKNDKKDPLQQFDKLNKTLSKIKQSLIISTWTTFGWHYAITKLPDFPKYFDKIIYLGGLEEKYMIDMLTKRFEEFSFDTIKKPSDIFTQQQLETIFNNSAGNPRLIIEIVSKCIENAAGKGESKISNEIIEEILTGGGTNQVQSIEDSKLIYDKLFLSLLSNRKVSIETITLFTGQERSTVQKIIEFLTNEQGLLIRENNPNKPKEFLYSIKSILRAKSEGALMQSIIEKQNANT